MLAQIPAKLINIPLSERQKEIENLFKDVVKEMKADFLFSDDGAFAYACFDGKLTLLGLVTDYESLN